VVQAIEDGVESVDRVSRSREQLGFDQPRLDCWQQPHGRPLEGLPP
jgi:hypothetical protein